MVHCSVDGCQSGEKGTKNNRFFPFPTEDKLLKARWRRGLGLPRDFQPKEDGQTKVCQKHFKEVCDFSAVTVFN